MPSVLSGSGHGSAHHIGGFACGVCRCNTSVEMAFTMTTSNRLYGLRVSFIPSRHRNPLFVFPPSLAIRPQHEHLELLGSLAIEPVPFSWRKPVECIKGHLPSTTHRGWSACTAWCDGTRRKFRTAAFFLSSVHLQRGQGRRRRECGAIQSVQWRVYTLASS